MTGSVIFATEGKYSGICVTCGLVYVKGGIYTNTQSH